MTSVGAYQRPALEVAEVLRAHGAAFLAKYGGTLDERQELGSQRTTFDVSRLPAGPYLFRLKTVAGETAREMVVKAF